jgi:hypothetical protein
MRFLANRAGSTHAPNGTGPMHAKDGTDPVRSPAGIGPRYAPGPARAADSSAAGPGGGR